MTSCAVSVWVRGGRATDEQINRWGFVRVRCGSLELSPFFRFSQRHLRGLFVTDRMSYGVEKVTPNPEILDRIKYTTRMFFYGAGKVTP